MRRLVICFCIFFLTSVAIGQSPSLAWIHTVKNDPLRGTNSDVFVLAGNYLTSPRAPSPGFTPAIVVVCEDGKVKQNYFSFGAVISDRHLEGRFDEKHVSIVGDDLSSDGQSVLFARVDLARVLKAHKVIVGALEYLANQVVMEFDIQDSSELLQTCSRDRILAYEFKKK